MSFSDCAYISAIDPNAIEIIHSTYPCEVSNKISILVNPVALSDQDEHIVVAHTVSFKACDWSNIAIFIFHLFETDYKSA